MFLERPFIESVDLDVCGFDLFDLLQLIAVGGNQTLDFVRTLLEILPAESGHHVSAVKFFLYDYEFGDFG